jgi:hypothetical protein
MLLTFRQRKTSSRVTGCCTSIAQFHGSHLQAKEDEQNRMLDEHRMALLSFMLLTFRQRKTSSSRTGCCKSIAQFHASHLQAKEDEQQGNWTLHEHMMAMLSFMVLTFRQRKTRRIG